MSLLAPILALYDYVLQPIAPFSYFGLSISTLDVAATFRLCVALRQLRESSLREHVAKHHAQARIVGEKGSRETSTVDLGLEPRSFVREASTVLTVVYGGEAVTGPLLGTPPSFMLSGVVPALYTAVQAVVELLPAVPVPSLESELPLAIMDGITRAYLLCSLIPPVVLTHTSTAVATSPWTLLLTSLISANGGFFFTGLFSLLRPTRLTVATPPELLPYGWTAADLWCAPFITGLYALLTHAQPFWADAHAVLSGVLGGAALDGKVAPLTPEVARAACALVLAALFSTRAVKNFGSAVFGTQAKVTREKIKVQ